MIAITELEQAHIDEVKEEIEAIVADIEAIKQTQRDEARQHACRIDYLLRQIEKLEAELAEITETEQAHFVTFYTVTQHYGGPEEGGWWFNTQEPTTELQVVHYGKHDRWDCDNVNYDFRDCPDCNVRKYVNMKALSFASYEAAVEAALWLNHARPLQSDDGLVVAIVEFEPYTSTGSSRRHYE